MPEFIRANWDAPPNVHALTTTRVSGCSEGPYAGFNLGASCGDIDEHVANNRQQLIESLSLPNAPYWIKQVHGADVIEATQPYHLQNADGSYTTQAGTVLAVLTADCLPLLISNAHGSVIACVHAGWRSLLAGIVDTIMHKIHRLDDHWFAWLGPAISQSAFEVGPEVRSQFLERDAALDFAFVPGREDRAHADLQAIAAHALAKYANVSVSKSEHCTFDERERFFSYRRDGQTGRMATLIWFD